MPFSAIDKASTATELFNWTFGELIEGERMSERVINAKASLRELEQ